MFENISLSTLYYFLGSTVAFLLGILQIRAYLQDQIKLSINLNVSSFKMFPPDKEQVGYIQERGYTDVSIDVDFKNKGRQPVTISKAELISANYDNHLKLYNNAKKRLDGGPSYHFEPIRLDSNDRLDINFFNHGIEYIEDFESFDWFVLFYTSHKEIKKKLTLKNSRK